jgi:transaldolase
MRIDLSGSRLHDLQTFRQSAWLECMHPRTLAGSQLAHLVRDGISGVDANLVGLAGAYAEDGAYREVVAELRAAGATAQQIYERMSMEDLRRAADRLRRVYNNTSGHDGYVSFDVSPALADDADGTESEARRLWSMIDRPNAMIKVPATDAGLVAIRRLVAAGLNVNATAIFGVRRYRQVADAYLLGLEDRAAQSLPLERVASVASVFVSHIDTAVDKELDAIQQVDKAARAKRLRGRAAVAVAQFAYQRYKIVIASPRWQLLAACHAQPQRLLWASADIHDAHCSDLKYVNELIGRDTITAMSMSTLDAYRDHGVAAPKLEHDLLEVLALFGDLDALRIDLDRVSTQLERDSLGETAAGLNARLTRLASAA